MDEFLWRARPWAVTLVLHNWPLLLGLPLILLAALRAFAQPTRRSLLLLYGVSLLVIAFEYQKHVVPSLRSTTTYLFSSEANSIPRMISQAILVGAMPGFLTMLGAALLVAWLVGARMGRASPGARRDGRE
jgi:uncharacterized membrane protein